MRFDLPTGAAAGRSDYFSCGAQPRCRASRPRIAGVCELGAQSYLDVSVRYSSVSGGHFHSSSPAWKCEQDRFLVESGSVLPPSLKDSYEHSR